MKKTTIHVILPLVIGGIIYIAFRSLSLRLFYWLDFIGIETIVSFVRNSIYPIKFYLPSWVYYSLPDGLWVYSYSSALIILWGDQYMNMKFWLIVTFLLSILIEIGQAFNLLPGTFDVIDILFCIIASSLSVILVKPKILRNESK